MRLTATVLGVVATAAIAATAVFGVLAWSSQDRDAGALMAIAAARQVALNLTSINADTADADLQRLLDSTTGDFHTQFASRQEPFVQIVRQANVSTTGNVTAAGLDTMNSDSARVLLAVHAVVTNSGAQQGEDRNYRLAITMQHMDDGRWLASSVDFVA
ncbi:hypothetical protein [Pseudonocardia sp. T1-2H]|uniref:hypothetical protein n=1 Tax=Pseudonocardia sp. T1-2H TaxID=3128899 RepID=UPI0031013BD2